MLASPLEMPRRVVTTLRRSYNVEQAWIRPRPSCSCLTLALTPWLTTWCGALRLQVQMLTLIVPGRVDTASRVIIEAPDLEERIAAPEPAHKLGRSRLTPRPKPEGSYRGVALEKLFLPWMGYGAQMFVLTTAQAPDRHANNPFDPMNAIFVSLRHALV